MRALATSRNMASKLVIIAVLAVLCILSVVICVGVGTVRFTPAQVLRAIFIEDDSPARLLVWNLRLPRILTGALVGMCLALSGCILQAVMRNSLASPTTIGVTSGAGFVGYLTLVAFPAYSFLLPVGSILGALLTTLLIFGLAYRKGSSPVRMILAGLAVSAMFNAFNDMVRTLFPESLSNATGFLVGGLNGCGWSSFTGLLPFAVVGLLACMLLPLRMNILMLGDEEASGLGLGVQSLRLVLIVTASLLSGAAISVAGIIGFVGLIVPHIARLVIGSDYRFQMPAAALMGAVLVVVCDTIGRVILPPGEISVSIILAFIGAPFFLYLLHAREAR